MHDPGHRSASSCAHIRRCSRDCAGRRKSAEQRRDDVRCALGEQFRAGPVPAADHSVRDNRGKQDSTAARKAITKADGRSSLILAILRCGIDGVGSRQEAPRNASRSCPPAAAAGRRPPKRRQ